jgi:Protein of unknown function (DUF1186)
MFIRRGDVDRYLEIVVEAALEKLSNKKHHRLINNTIVEMQWWACFNNSKHL